LKPLISWAFRPIKAGFVAIGKTTAAAFRTLKPPTSSDIALVVGFALLGRGLWMYSPRISLTITGATIIVYGVASEFLGEILRHKRKQGPK
jgi:hypothetical protein